MQTKMQKLIQDMNKEEREKLSNIIEEDYKNIISPDLENFIEEHYISKQEMKEKIEKGIGVLISSSKVEEYEKDIMFNTGKGCGLNFGISILNKLLKELNI